jgi:hypothetical protein
MDFMNADDYGEIGNPYITPSAILLPCYCSAPFLDCPVHQPNAQDTVGGFSHDNSSDTDFASSQYEHHQESNNSSCYECKDLLYLQSQQESNLRSAATHLDDTNDQVGVQTPWLELTERR